MIDLRSDTVTRPTPAMRRAMAEAEVGDDVYGEDPTINRLEKRSAEITGKEAALFVPTGSMGNTIGIKVNTHHGQEIICDDRAHILDWEMAMAGWYCGCLPRTVRSANGTLTWELIEPVLRPPGDFLAHTGVINLEHPHNMGGGALYAIDEIDRICDNAHARGVRVHMDGARLFNAAVASRIPAARIVSKVDTVMFCLSKGLGAPVGSMLVGSVEAMGRARLHRKQLGGGMRQAGVLAAAGLIALDQAARLHEDHANARTIAGRVARLPGIRLDPDSVVTNIVIFEVTSMTGAAFCERLATRGVLASAIAPQRVRLVTHLDVSTEDCRRAAEAIESVGA